MNKWSNWYDSLTPQTKQYLKGRAIWTDKDLIRFASATFVAGIILGMVI